MTMWLKPLKVIDAKYKIWLKKINCLLCGRVSDHGHHLPNPEGGKRRSRDDLQVPLCFRCHRRMHDKPLEEKQFLEMFYQRAKELWRQYGAEKLDNGG